MSLTSIRGVLPPGSSEQLRPRRSRRKLPQAKALTGQRTPRIDPHLNRLQFWELMDGQVKKTAKVRLPHTNLVSEPPGCGRRAAVLGLRSFLL